MKEIPLPRIEDPRRGWAEKYKPMAQAVVDYHLAEMDLDPKELPRPGQWPRVGEWEEFANSLDKGPPVG